MINLASYFFFNLSNLIFSLLIPNSFAKIFFFNFSLASGLATFLIFLNFSKKENISYKFIIIFLFLFLLLNFYFRYSVPMVVWVYSFVLIYADYFFSQKKVQVINLLLKISLFILTPLILLDSFNAILIIKIKLFLIFIFFLIFFLFSREKKNTDYLKVSHPINYTILTCIIYFGSLFLISNLFEDNILKIYYVSLQIALGVRLKLFDIKIRGIAYKNINFELFFSIFSYAFFVILSFYFLNALLLIIFCISYISLSYVNNKYIIKN